MWSFGRRSRWKPSADMTIVADMNGLLPPVPRQLLLPEELFRKWPTREEMLDQHLLHRPIVNVMTVVSLKEFEKIGI